ncbi:MAG: hypothetical protein BMS9Abin05_1606 [Rhodothermia bacterium]|nr:MAG: hypothetical protein BMS9Abin05_1606 [Rhodothermia bacterium]
MKNRLSYLLLFALFSLNFTSLRVAGPGEFVGHWDGLADEQVVFTLDISLDGTDLIAVINAPEQGLSKLESEWTSFGGDHEVQLSFEMPENGTLMLTGKLNDAGKFIGAYEFGEQTGTFIMNKKEEG